MNCKKGMATFLALAVAANATSAPVHAEGKSFLERMETLERANWTMAPWRNVLNTLGDLPEDIDKLDEFFLQDQYFNGNLTLAEKIFNAPARTFENYNGYNALNVKRTFDGKFNRYNLTNTCKLAKTPEEISREQEAYDAMALEQRFDARFGDVCMSDEAVHDYKQQVAEVLQGSWLELVNGTDLMLHMKDGRVFNCADLLPAGLCKDLIRTFTEEGREAAERQLPEGIIAILAGSGILGGAILAKLIFDKGTTPKPGAGPDDGSDGGSGHGGGGNSYKGLNFEQKKAELKDLLMKVQTRICELRNNSQVEAEDRVQAALDEIIGNTTVGVFMARPGAVTEGNIDKLLQHANELVARLNGLSSDEQKNEKKDGNGSGSDDNNGNENLTFDQKKAKLQGLSSAVADKIAHLRMLASRAGGDGRVRVALDNIVGDTVVSDALTPSAVTEETIDELLRCVCELDGRLDELSSDSQVNEEHDEIDNNHCGSCDTVPFNVAYSELLDLLGHVQVKVCGLTNQQRDQAIDLVRKAFPFLLWNEGERNFSFFPLDIMIRDYDGLLQCAKQLFAQIKALSSGEQETKSQDGDEELEFAVKAEGDFNEVFELYSDNANKRKLSARAKAKARLAAVNKAYNDALADSKNVETIRNSLNTVEGQISSQVQSEKSNNAFNYTTNGESSLLTYFRQVQAKLKKMLKALEEQPKEEKEEKDENHNQENKQNENQNGDGNNDENKTYIHKMVELSCLSDELTRKVLSLDEQQRDVAINMVKSKVPVFSWNFLEFFVTSTSDVNENNINELLPRARKLVDQLDELFGGKQETKPQDEEEVSSEESEESESGWSEDEEEEIEFAVKAEADFKEVFETYSENATKGKPSARAKAKARLDAVNKAYNAALQDSKNVETILNSLNTVEGQINSQAQSERSIRHLNYTEDNESSLLTYFRAVKAQLEEMLNELKKSEDRHDDRDHEDDEKKEVQVEQPKAEEVKEEKEEKEKREREEAERKRKEEEERIAREKAEEERKRKEAEEEERIAREKAEEERLRKEAEEKARKEEEEKKRKAEEERLKKEQEEKARKEEQALEAARAECKQAIEKLNVEIGKAKRSSVSQVPIQEAESLVNLSTALLNNNDVSAIKGQTQALKTKTNTLKQITAIAEDAPKARLLKQKKTDLKTALDNLRKTFDDAVRDSYFADKNEDQYHETNDDGEYWAKLAKENIRLGTQILTEDDCKWDQINNKADSVNELIKNLENFIAGKKLRKEQDEINEVVESIGNGEVAVEEVADGVEKAKLAKQIDIRIKAYEGRIKGEFEINDISKLDYEDMPGWVNLVKIKAALENDTKKISKEKFERLKKYSDDELFRLDGIYSKGLKAYAKQCEKNLDVAIENATNAGQNQEKIKEADQLKQKIINISEDIKKKKFDPIVNVLIKVEEAIDSLNEKEVVIEVKEIKDEIKEKPVEKKDVLESVQLPDSRDTYAFEQIRKQRDWQVMLRPENNLIQQMFGRNQQQTVQKKNERPLQAEEEQSEQVVQKVNVEPEITEEQLKLALVQATQAIQAIQSVQNVVYADGRVKAAQAALQAAQGDPENKHLIEEKLEQVNRLINEHNNANDEVGQELARIKAKLKKMLKALEESENSNDDSDQEDDNEGGQDGGMKEDKEKKDDKKDEEKKDEEKKDDKDENQNNNNNHSHVGLAYVGNVVKNIPGCLFTKENFEAAAVTGLAAAASGTPAAGPVVSVAAIGYNTIKCAQEKADIDWERMRLEEAARRNNGLNLGERSSLSRLNGLDDGEKNVANFINDMSKNFDEEMRLAANRGDMATLYGYDQNDLNNQVGTRVAMAAPDRM